ncbi:MAG: TIGR01777 family protein [Acidobacteria bacterium]|nr:TIGR01777 family protein [Acidobacteriota bacterium]
MKIVIPGGSGQVGRIITRAFTADGHEVVVLSRGSSDANGGRVVQWDAKTQGEWIREIDGADVVVNLAGRIVNCRYNAENRREIMDSRVDSTKAVGEAIVNSKKPPRVWLQASTATIYAHRFDAANDDLTGSIGGSEPDAPDTWNFSIDVARAWEAAANSFEVPNTRLVLMRSAVTMSPDRGGIFDVMLGLVRRGLGGTAGNGRQFISWIHERDFVGALKFLIGHDSISGPVNIASPNPLPNREFMRIFRDSWGTKIGLPASKLMLEIGAILMRTETELILKSRRVVPRRLLDAGFEFEFADWRDACRDLCERFRARSKR